jgi:hypothetical protein
MAWTKRGYIDDGFAISRPPDSKEQDYVESDAEYADEEG